jgi:hypothetical protein
MPMSDKEIRAGLDAIQEHEGMTCKMEEFWPQDHSSAKDYKPPLAPTAPGKKSLNDLKAPRRDLCPVPGPVPTNSITVPVVDVKKETEKAWLVAWEVERGRVREDWFPKSKCALVTATQGMSDGRKLVVPRWLMDEKLGMGDDAL